MINSKANVVPARWRFYGREQEMIDLGAQLNVGPRAHPDRAFYAFSIAGRRNVGKNLLLEETVKRYGNPAELLVVELPKDGTDKEHLTELEKTIKSKKLDQLLDDLPEPYEKDYEANLFVDICWHLIGKGIIVCLDEFHNAKNGYIESSLKKMIDTEKRAHLSGKSSSPGKLVLMGSHQQEFADALSSKRPLFGRVPTKLLLKPWPLSTVLEMAREHGWLCHPGRFLTLWTAYGGMPNLWERFATDVDAARLRDTTAEADHDEWRKEFLIGEQRILHTDERSRFDDRATFEFQDEMRDALICLARRRDRDQSVRQVQKALRVKQNPYKLVNHFERLMDHYQMVRHQNRFAGPWTNRPRWMVSDNNTLFQAYVFRELFHFRRQPPPEQESQWVPPLVALRELEGKMLERLAVAWLNEHPQVQWSHFGALSMAGGSDIDVLARIGDGISDDDILVIGSAKRNAGKQELKSLPGDLDAFLAGSIGEDFDEASDIRHLRRCWLLFAPEFTAEQMIEQSNQAKRLGLSAFACFGLPEMVADTLDNGWAQLDMCLNVARGMSPAPENHERMKNRAGTTSP